MIRKQIAKEYDVLDGIIKSPGKFEGCPIYAPYFYDLILNGGCDSSSYDGFISYDHFVINSEDIKNFPELEGIQQITCYETDDGFFHLYYT